VLTRHWLVDHLRLINITVEIAIDSYPVHLATLARLLLAHQWNVVFRLTGNRAGVAANARVQINAHPPLITGIVAVFLPQRLQGRMLFHLGYGTGVLPVVGDSQFAHEGSALHTPVILRIGQRVGTTSRGERHSATHVRLQMRSQRVRIESDAVPHPSGSGAAVSERCHNGVIGLAGDDPNAAKASLSDLAGAIAAVDVRLWGPVGSKVWSGAQAGMVKALSLASSGDGIGGIRVAFEPLSNTMAALARRMPPTGTRVYYRIRCPMAFDGRGAEWLQRDQDVRNPYFGASMFRCGSVEEVIGRGADDAPTPGEAPK